MKKPLTKGQRANLQLQILRKAKQNPEFEKKLIQQMNERQNQPKSDESK